MDYKGFYINLARSIERKEQLESHLKKLGLFERYERFDAVEGRDVCNEYEVTHSPGTLGCWLSHLKLLQENLASDYHLHVIEDDVTFSQAFIPFIDSLSDSFEWDLIFTDVYFHPAPSYQKFFQLLAQYKKSEKGRHISLNSLKGLSFTGTSSYLVNKNAIGKIAKLIEDPTCSEDSVDIFLNNLVQQGRISAYTTMPFLTSLNVLADDSTIEEEHDLQGYNLLRDERRSFFVDSDSDQLLADMRAITGKLKIDPEIEIYLEVLKWKMQEGLDKL